MKILVIACNTVGDSDGIGKHARLVAEELNKRDAVEKVALISGNTVGFNRLELVLSMQMAKAFLRAISIIKKEQYDVVIVEYPFNEYNPIIVVMYKMMRSVCIKRKCKLALSMHEYDRVKALRRLAIQFMLLMSDFVFVSEPHYLKKIKYLNEKLYIRNIPNHIPIYDFGEKDKYTFVYFGFINKSKAFMEMITAWDIFNYNNKYTLNIITATTIDFNLHDHKNIYMHVGVDDLTASEIMRNSYYSILPVRPHIGYNNSSFISTIQCGCIPIGHFNENLQSKNFVICVENYSIENLVSALHCAVNFSDMRREELSRAAYKFGKQFTISATVDMMLQAIKTECED